MITAGTLLGGRVRYDQPAAGFRSGIEPVLLAASIPVRAGERVLEAGTGAGAALLCLLHRVGGLQAVGVEVDAEMASLARANVAANQFGGCEIVTGAIEAALSGHVFDHALANPPYHQPEGSVSPDAARETAKRGSPALLARWIIRLASMLRHRGSLTLVLPVGQVPLCLRVMEEAKCPCTILFPLWPKAGREAKLVLIRGVAQARAPMRVMAGLVLHEADGTFTPKARAILNDGAALVLDDHLSSASG